MKYFISQNEIYIMKAKHTSIISYVGTKSATRNSDPNCKLQSIKRDEVML